MSVTVANTTSNLSGKTLLLAERDTTITGLQTFDRDPSAPFAVTSGSAVVTNLNADLLDGLDSLYFTNASNIASGTLALARLPSGIAGDYCNGRLTLTTAVPVTTADVTAAGTLYFTPYKGNRISLYDGAATWTTYTFTEKSLALTLTSGKPYDIFMYDNSGVPALESLIWTNDTTRATALVYQDGVLVKSGATTRRYLGSIYSSGANTTEDSFAKRYVWNYYNRLPRPMRVIEPTDSYAYSTNTWRQARATATNQLDFIVGYAEEVIAASVIGNTSTNNVASQAWVGIGEDSTTTPDAGCVVGASNGFNTSLPLGLNAELKKLSAAGRHTWVWLEKALTGTITWYGDNAADGTQSGIHGVING